MKKGYKIGLFFVILVIAVLIILILIRRASYEQLEEEIEKMAPIQSSEVDNKEQRTTCDTLVLYQNIDKKDGTITYNEEKIPYKYINMTRQELDFAIEQDNKCISLSEKEKGFVSQHLELFSPDRIKITRIYDTTTEKAGYYLLAVNNSIWIFKYDKKTLYFKTDLTLDDVPEKIRNEIIEGKYMNSEIEIYSFLESYSS